MCNKATLRSLAGALTLLAGMLPAQITTDWRQVGNSAIDRGLSGLASGPVDRVWYSANGEILFALTAAGRVYQTTDFESWQLSSATAPGKANPVNYSRDVAVAPGNPDEIVLAGDAGIFRSLDGGLSWSGLNDALPNLPVTRLLRLPTADQGVRVQLLGSDAAEWPPGGKQAWLPAEDADLRSELALRRALGLNRDATVTALAIAGNFIYTGMVTGEIQVSEDRGVTWRAFTLPGSGPVERFWVDPNDPRVALAALGASPGNPFLSSAPAHVLHTNNGGAFWDNFTANLPDVPAHGVAADRSSGAVYVATERGVFLTYVNLGSLAIAPGWTLLPGLPAAAAMDIKLDAEGNQLWAAVEGYGVYATLAPHRLRDPRVVSAADLIARAVAPGSLVTVLGARIDSMRMGDWTAPVLAATASESQIQVPFESGGNSISLLATTAQGSLTFPAVPLASAVPAIFVGRDGSPMLLDADSGVMLDAMTTAHSGTRIQILATGLGRVLPAWPTGLPAPVENPPRVAGMVHAYLDRAPVEVTRAVLAPGYVGFYLIEITVPKVVNYGPEELYLDVDGATSNRVRVYIEP